MVTNLPFLRRVFLFCVNEVEQKQTIALDYLEDSTTEEVYSEERAADQANPPWVLLAAKNGWSTPDPTAWSAERWWKTLKDTTKTFLEVASKQVKGEALSAYLIPRQRKSKLYWIFNGSFIFLRDLYHYPSDPDYDELGSLEITDAFVDECSQVTRKAKGYTEGADQVQVGRI